MNLKGLGNVFFFQTDFLLHLYDLPPNLMYVDYGQELGGREKERYYDGPLSPQPLLK